MRSLRWLIAAWKRTESGLLPELVIKGIVGCFGFHVVSHISYSDSFNPA